MKKYSRLILEILLGICLVATAALAYWNFSAKKHLNEQVAELSEQLDEAKESLEKVHEEAAASHEPKEEPENTAAQEMDALKSAFANGVMDQGVDVILIGLASTDGLYFASGKLNLPGAMFTASHNPEAEPRATPMYRPGPALGGQ